MLSLIVLVVLVVLVIIGFQYVQRKSLPETIISIDPNDPAILKAIADAQASLPNFWEKKISALNSEDYSIKVRIQGHEKAESIWLSDPSIDGDKVSGIVNQSPAYLCVREGQRITCETSQVNDWMYMESDRIHGNFTGRVMGKPQNMSLRQYQAILGRFRLRTSQWVRPPTNPEKFPRKSNSTTLPRCSRYQNQISLGINLS